MDASGRVAVARANVAAGDAGWQEQGRIVLNAQARQGVVAVGQPDALGVFQNAKVDASTARGAGFNLYLWMGCAQAVQQGVGAACLGRVVMREHTVVVPFDVFDVVAG